MVEAFQICGQKIDGRPDLAGPHHPALDDRLDFGGQADNHLAAANFLEERAGRAGQAFKAEIAAFHRNFLPLQAHRYCQADRDPRPAASF
jgi:hypothetical protein